MESRLRVPALLLALAILAADFSARADDAPIPVVDLHVDLSYEHNYQHQAFAQGTQFPAAKLVPSGVRGVVLPLFVPFKVSPNGPRAEDLEASYQAVSSALTKTPPFVAGDGCASGTGQVGSWFAFEGSGPLANDPDAVKRWVDRGVRLFGLVHTRDNELASSSATPNPSFGLTDAGRAFVHRVHAAGALVDISHASDRAAREVLALAQEDGVPVVATHSNARKLADHPRNLSDDLLLGIARSGGVVGVNFHGSFLARGRAAKFSDAVAQVRHLVNVMGVDHVAVGSDFEGDIRPPAELSDVGGYQRLAQALEKSGLERSAVEKIFYQNALRVLCPKR